MLILSTITDILEVNLGASSVSPLPVLVSFRDITTTSYTPGRQITNTDGTTVVTVLSSPVAATQRVVDFMIIRNPNSANAAVSIYINIATVRYTIFNATLAQGESIQYQDGVGFTVLTIQGAVKNSINQGTNSVATGDSVVVLSSDVINNNAVANTMQDITGLSLPVVSGTRYWFQFFIRYTAAATTTGSRWSVNGPTFNELGFRVSSGLTTTSWTMLDGLSTYDTPAAASASSTATGSNIAVIEGVIRSTADGNVIGRFASEVANSAITAKAGSFLRYRAL